MGIQVSNLFLHSDGGYYCLLNADAPLKHPDSGEWCKGVIYMGIDGQMRSTTLHRWATRFEPVADYTGDDEAVLRMIRRANPGSVDLDFVRIFESWHESEMNITGQMLELAVGATILDMMDGFARAGLEAGEPYELTITTEDLQQVVQNYEIERVPEPHGFKFVVRKSFPDSA